MRCLRCGSPTANPDGPCGVCKTQVRALDPIDDVTIRINWHELRLLTMWAERWASHQTEAGASRAEPNDMLGSLYAVLDRIHAQHLAMPPLTLEGELATIHGASA